METWQRWQEMARESERADRLAEAEDCFRSAASRYYYAAYQAATALLIYRGLIPPADREAWSHEGTPNVVADDLGKIVPSRDKRQNLATRLKRLYDLRLIADYKASRRATASAVQKAGRDARHILSVAQDVLPERKQQ